MAKGKFNKKKKNQTDANVQPSVQPTSVEQSTNQYTQQQIDEILDDLAVQPTKKQRVWEVDFFRGLMILVVIWDHFIWDVTCVVPGGSYKTALFQWLQALSPVYYMGVFRAVIQPAFVTLFVMMSGVSCSFSRNNFKRGLKMSAFALILTLAMMAADSLFNTGAIYFNVIHVVAFSVLLWSGIQWIWGKLTKNWQKNVFGVVMFAMIATIIVVGECARFPTGAGAWTNENPLWFFLARHNLAVPGYFEFCGVDSVPFFPDFGWFLVGAFLGKALYKEKKTWFPSVNTKYVRPITFIGQKSLWFYFGSQIFMYAFFYLFHYLLNWL